MLTKGFSKEELQKAKEQIKKSLEVNLKKNTYWKNYISEQYFNGDPLNEYISYQELLEKLTVKDILSVIQPLFNTKHYVAVYQYPEKKESKKEKVNKEENNAEEEEVATDENIHQKDTKKKKK